MVRKISKRQNPIRVEQKAAGVIIDCDEIEISIFAPPDPIIIVDGFSARDLETISKIIFDDPVEGEISNDEFLLKGWEKLHDESKES